MTAMKFYRLLGRHLAEVNRVQQDHYQEKISTEEAHARVDRLLEQLRLELDETPATDPEETLA
jgi:outer membrane protein assembly factor BamD (BamD/ComL family)